MSCTLRTVHREEKAVRPYLSRTASNKKKMPHHTIKIPFNKKISKISLEALIPEIRANKETGPPRKIERQENALFRYSREFLVK